MMRTIQGDTKPKAEQKTLYELSTIILKFTSSVFSPHKEEKYVWTLYKLVNNQWKKVENNIKYGEKNTYQFGQGVVGIPFKIMVHSEEKDILQVNRNKLIAELTVVPKTAKEPVIGRVILLNKSNKDVNKAKFNEHLTAQARTSNLLGKEITFYLWEEGASEFEKYKNPKKGRVNKHGIAEVRFNLSEYASPATFMTFFGGNNATKKFFVTATYEGKGETNKTPVVATDGQQQAPKATTTPTQQKPQQPPTQQPTQAPNNQGTGIIAKSREIIAEGIGNFFNAIENSISAAQVGSSPKKENPAQKKEKCFCNRDFEEKDVRQFVKLLKGTETIWEGQALKGGKRAICNISDKSFATLTKELNAALKKYNINTCAQKMHFLAQACEETGTFALSEETKGKHSSSLSVYKGRGLLQLTGVKKNKSDEFYNEPGPYKDYADYKGDQNILKTPEIVASNIHYCIDSGAWEWSVSKKMPKAPSDAVDRWGAETSGKSLNELAIYVDKYLELISVLLNGRNSKTKMPNGWAIRQSNYDTLKNFFFMYDRFHKDNNKPVDTKNIVSYHIYANGEIEKHIPRSIKPGYEKKYTYIYHDISGNLHELGTYDIIPTQIYGGAKGTKINLINLDTIKKSYKKGDYQYTFNVDSPRKYVNEKTLASIFGAMLEVNYNDISCNGFSHPDGSSRPSVSHINGNNGDFKYLRKDKKLMFGDGTSLDIDANPDMLDDVRQNKWNNALYKFGWKHMLGWTYKRNGKIHYLNHLPKNTKDHYHHLHVQRYNPSFKEIKK